MNDNLPSSFPSLLGDSDLIETCFSDEHHLENTPVEIEYLKELYSYSPPRSQSYNSCPLCPGSEDEENFETNQMKRTFIDAMEPSNNEAEAQHQNRVEIGFSTASNKKITVNKASLKKARTLLEDDANMLGQQYETHMELEEQDDLSMSFTTASFKPITVSPKSLTASQKLLGRPL